MIRWLRKHEKEHDEVKTNTSIELKGTLEREEKEETGAQNEEETEKENCREKVDICKALQEKNYEDVIKVIEESEEEANISIVEKDENCCVIKRMRPLHAAVIISAPLLVIEAIIKASPDSPKLQDSMGMLPIHIAFCNQSKTNITIALLNAYPQSVVQKDNKDMYPHDYTREMAKTFALYVEARAKAERSCLLKNMLSIDKSKSSGKISDVCGELQMVESVLNDKQAEEFRKLDKEQLFVVLEEEIEKKKAAYERELSNWILTYSREQEKLRSKEKKLEVNIEMIQCAKIELKIKEVKERKNQLLKVREEIKLKRGKGELEKDMMKDKLAKMNVVTMELNKKKYRLRRQLTNVETAVKIIQDKLDSEDEARCELFRERDAALQSLDQDRICRNVKKMLMKKQLSYMNAKASASCESADINVTPTKVDDWLCCIPEGMDM